MGCHPSKLKRISHRSDKYEIEKGHEENKNYSEPYSDSVKTKKLDEQTLSDIRKDLNKNPEMFVLNNVLMCTMFLKNYQKEVNEVFDQIHNIEKRFINPDLIMEKANENITYRPLHGPKKEYSEPLVTKRIFVPMNDFIEVYNEFDDTENVQNNGGYKYQVKMEESRRKGFVKLKRLIQSNRSPQDRNSLKDLLTVPSSSASGSSDTESSEGTSTGTAPKGNPQLIKDQNDESSLQDCFVFRKVKKADIDINLEDLDHKNLTEDDVYDIVSYLPSRNFMKYFQSKIFKNSIAQELGLVQYEIDYAIVDDNIPGKIFCNLQDHNGNSYPVEVLPCLTIPWPESKTGEFLLRQPLNEQTKDLFIWPTQEMINEIRMLECALVPKGYLKKRGEYPEGDLEWEIHFPLAERYMECLLRPEQIKCYLVLLTLFKEYIEPYTKKHGIGPEHLRTLIFWESEIDYDSWPEHRLGIRLMNLINKFHVALHRRDLPDYFIGKKKNVFKSIHMRHLLHANEVFHNITQSPVTWIIRALRNLRTTSGNFYPPLDYKQLLDILYKRDWETLDPHLSMINDDEDDLSFSTTSLEKKPKYADAEKQLEYVRERERKKILMKKREKLNNVNNVGNLRYSVGNDKRRESVDSIKDDWECEKKFDVQKKIALLKFFINNYLEIAKTSSRISTTKQTKFYLKQAWYLTKILHEENRLFEEEVKDLFAKIRGEEEKCEIQERVEKNKNSKATSNVSENNPVIRKNKDRNQNEINSIFENITKRNEFIANGVVQQQVGQKQTNFNSLSRSFSNNYPSISDNYQIEDFR